jgi:hypothetical protein
VSPVQNKQMFLDDIDEISSVHSLPGKSEQELEEANKRRFRITNPKSEISSI